MKQDRYTDEDAGRKFVEFDRELDRTSRGPVWLKDPRIAKLVVNALKYGEQTQRYDLHAYVVMANHVHVLLTPMGALGQITRDLKGLTGRQANELLDRKGQLFWKSESYDHWVRTPQEFRGILNYIEWNPVKAGIVKDPFEYEWSSAGWRVTREQEREDGHRARPG